MSKPQGIKLITIVGARPQFIKASAVIRAIQEFNKREKRIRELLVHTGQHYDYLMDRVFFEELRLPEPDYHLGVGSGSHARQTGLMLERIEAILQKEIPHVVMVYGDTNSTLAGALAAAKLNLPVAHVEAGLRSYNRTMPEEINRVLTDHLSTFLFCPTSQAVENLAKEGIRLGQGKIVKNVGDVMYDSILFYSQIAEKKSTILEDLGLYNPQSVIGHRQYYLATLHRAENTDNLKRLTSILKALNKIGRTTSIILPLHPRTEKRIKNYRLFPKFKEIKFIDPVSYLDMLKLEKNAKAILTDSGGIQKEAYWFGVPCFTLREETEWVETIEQGWNKLVGTDEKKIIEMVNPLAGKSLPEKRAGLFGGGKAGEAIIRLFEKRFR
jgi:UDP-GlcNAc3NAcA epimerase